MDIGALFSIGGSLINLITGGKPGVVIGGIALSGRNAPTTMPFGGTQKVTRQELPGGVLVLDLMGAFDRNIDFSGTLRDYGAVAIARRLDALRVAGQPVTLTWADFTRQIVIETCDCDYQRMGYEVPYHIVAHVIPSPAAQAPLGFLQKLGADISDSLGLSALAPAMQTAQDAIQSARQALPVIGAISPSLAATASGYLSAGQTLTGGVRAVAEGNLGGLTSVTNAAHGLVATSAYRVQSATTNAQALATAATAAGYLARSQKSLAAAAS
jgi:hypothetical protein